MVQAARSTHALASYHVVAAGENPSILKEQANEPLTGFTCRLLFVSVGTSVPTSDRWYNFGVAAGPVSDNYGKSWLWL